MGKITTFLLGLAVLLCLPACLGGNGEGVGDRPPTTPTNQPVPTIYYDLDPGQTCQIAGKEVYGRTISIATDGSLSFSDLCTQSSQSLFASDIEQASQWPLLGYQQDIYEARQVPPVPGDAQDTYAQALCFGASGDEQEIEIRNGSSLANPMAYVALKQNGQWASSQEGVQPGTQGTEQVFQGQSFTIAIDLGSTSLLPSEYTGVLSGSGSPGDLPLACRVAR